MVVNVLWPFVPAAFAIFYARPEQHLWIFILNYIAMVPTANLVGFAGQELARKLPKVFGMSCALWTPRHMCFFSPMPTKGCDSLHIKPINSPKIRLMLSEERRS